MKRILLAASFAAFGLGGAACPVAQAADAANPYGNIDHSNDAGNNTGDSRVEGLNSGQLDGHYQGTYQAHPPGEPAVNVPPPPNTPPPGAVPPPPPGAVVR